MPSEANELAKIKAILKSNPRGLTIEELSKRIPLNRTSTAKYLNTLLISGQAEMRTYGRAKVFTISHRVPLSQMISLTSDPILVLDKELFIKQVNDRFNEVFSVSKSDLIGHKIDFTPLNALDILIPPNKIHEAVEGQEQVFEKNVRNGEQEFFFKVKLVPSVFDDGDKGVVIFFEDITELKKYQHHLEQLVEERTAELQVTNEKLQREIEDHKRAKTALIKSEERYRTLVEASPNGIFFCDINYAIMMANPKAVTLFGYSSVNELIGKNMLQLVVNDDHDNLLGIFSRAGEEEIPRETEFSFIRKDRAAFPGEFITGPVKDHTGLSIGFIGVIMDITERKRAEEALRQANRKLNLLSSFTRHDILNQLTIVLGYLKMARDVITDPVANGFVSKAEESAGVIQTQITFTRDFQNIGVVPPEWQRIDELVKTSLNGLSPGKVSISVDLNGNEVYADPLLGKAFANIIGHSLHQDGSLSQIRVSSKDSGDLLTVLIEDDGSGIPDAEKEDIFDRALGGKHTYDLFLAREIMSITGISIRETGIFGKGSRFEISFGKGMYRGLETPVQR
jgi:PAS domain S-box-containing protein